MSQGIEVGSFFDGGLSLGVTERFTRIANLVIDLAHQPIVGTKLGEQLRPAVLQFDDHRVQTLGGILIRKLAALRYDPLRHGR